MNPPHKSLKESVRYAPESFQPAFSLTFVYLNSHFTPAWFAAIMGEYTHLHVHICVLDQFFFIVN